MNLEEQRPDEALIADLAALPSAAQLRLGAFRLFAKVLADGPAPELLEELHRTSLVKSLAELAERTLSPAAGALRGLADWLGQADEAALKAVSAEYQRLFVASRHLPAPPWESVYTSPERLVLQEAAREVLHAYADAGFVFDGWKSKPADHISLELSFAATLLSEGARDGKARERLKAFERQHLERWVPRFCADLVAATTSPFYRSVGEALPRLLQGRAEA